MAENNRKKCDSNIIIFDPNFSQNRIRVLSRFLRISSDFGKSQPSSEPYSKKEEYEKKLVYKTAIWLKLLRLESFFYEIHANIRHWKNSNMNLQLSEERYKLARYKRHFKEF